jgi:hypothetical protein
MPQVVWLLYHRQRGFDNFIMDRLFGVFSSQEAILKHMEWRKGKGYGTGPGFFVNPATLDEPNEPCGFTKDVVDEAGQFMLVDQTVASELAKERGPARSSIER